MIVRQSWQSVVRLGSDINKPSVLDLYRFERFVHVVGEIADRITSFGSVALNHSPTDADGARKLYAQMKARGVKFRAKRTGPMVVALLSAGDTSTVEDLLGVWTGQ